MEEEPILRSYKKSFVLVLFYHLRLGLEIVFFPWVTQVCNFVTN